MAVLFLFPHMSGQISCRLPVISRRLLRMDSRRSSLAAPVPVHLPANDA